MMYDELRERARSLSELISHQSTYGMALGDRDALYLIIEATLQWSEFSKQSLASSQLNLDIISKIKTSKNISYIVISDSNGNIIASFNEADFKIDPEVKKKLQAATATQLEEYRYSAREKIINSTSPILLRQTASSGESLMEESLYEETLGGETEVTQEPQEGRKIGLVHLGLSDTSIRSKIRDASIFTIIISVIAIIVGLIIAFIFARFITNPVDNVVQRLKEIAEGKAPQAHAFRVGGLVATNSVKRKQDGLTTSFSITDNAESVTVEYTGILPDLFREGQGIVALGQLNTDGVFVASEVLAKHDENYMPPEVAESLKTAHEAGVSGSQKVSAQ